MSSTLLFIFEIIGTVSFAISGAALGIKKKMDIFGVTILGIITAVGGGVIRDLILGRTPPATFENPIYALVAMAVSLITFMPFVRKLVADKAIKAYNIFMLITDSVGLGIFTVIGIKAANSLSLGHNIFLAIFVGVVTGCGGGVLRDIIADEKPYIFVKHFYATASIIGAIACSVLWSVVGEITAMLIGAGVVILLRLLAAHFRWSLPKA